MTHYNPNLRLDLPCKNYTFMSKNTTNEQQMLRITADGVQWKVLEPGETAVVFVEFQPVIISITTQERRR